MQKVYDENISSGKWKINNQVCTPTFIPEIWVVKIEILRFQLRRRAPNVDICLRQKHNI